jgi:hypothetical protein
MPGRVLQGCFPHGVPKVAASAVQPYAGRQPWVQQAIGRSAPLQAKAPDPRIVPLPAAPQRAATPLPANAMPPASGGQPLPLAVRQKMEAQFGTSFADVRVHVGPFAASVGALAVTHGSDIHFAPGQYQPGAPHTEQILRHELAHVVQQRTGRVRNPFGSGLAIVHDPVLDAEAARARIARGAPVRQLALAVAAAPVLSATHDAKADLEGPCGYFERRRAWNVANPVQGVIVQEVWRTFDVHEIGAPLVKMSSAALDTYVTAKSSSVCADDTHYWELWKVAADGTVDDGGEDTFGLCAIIPGRKEIDTTAGTFTIRGVANFYATTADPSALGFKRGEVQAAGGLFSLAKSQRYTKKTMPALGPATSGPVTCTVTATWDSTKGKDRYTNVTMT